MEGMRGTAYVRGREPGQIASGGWALASRNGGKKENKTTGGGFCTRSAAKLTRRAKAPRANSQLKGHEIPFTFSICDVTRRAKVCTPSPATSERKQELGKAFRRPQTVAFLAAAAERQPTSERDEALSRQISLFPSFIARRRVRETLCIIRLRPRAGGSEETVWE